MIGIGGALVILGVAGIAIGGSARELAVDMAERTIHADMRAGQRERSLRMVEIRPGPAGGVVTGGTIRGKTGLNVIGIGGALKILGMATVTIGGSARKFVVNVAKRAGHADMSAGQRERRFRVIENRTRPTGGAVAKRAIG